MKRTIKLLSIIMIAVLALTMAGCKSDNGKGRERRKKEKQKVNIEEIQKNKGELLVIKYSSMGERTEDYDPSQSQFSVSYSGYTHIPFNTTNLKMSDEDYLKIYNFCIYNADGSGFKDYKEDVCDGTSYTFIYYDTDGNEHIIYSGYCYENEELKGIIDTIGSYSVDY